MIISAGDAAELAASTAEADRLGAAGDFRWRTVFVNRRILGLLQRR